MSVDVELARQEWAQGYRRLREQSGEAAERLHADVEAVTAELRRRLGGVYTLDELAASLGRADAELRRLRPELPVGIGGSSRDGSLKCLHAHAAFALARPGYLLGGRILAEVEPRWRTNGCCTPGC